MLHGAETAEEKITLRPSEFTDNLSLCRDIWELLTNPTVLWEIKATMDVVLLVMVCDGKYRVPMHLFWSFSIFEDSGIYK